MFEPDLLSHSYHYLWLNIGTYRQAIADFWQNLEQDQQLQQQLEAAPDLESLVQTVVRLGQSRGYGFTHKDVETYLGIDCHHGKLPLH